MPHYKCIACKTRLYRSAGPADEVGDVCPHCESSLEPVGELAEVVGFQSIESRESADAGHGPGIRVDDFVTRREAILAQARLDAERWLDDGGSFQAEAVAMPRPETNL